MRIPQQRVRASPLSHPFEIQMQGHEPREGWQRGPAPGQTGSHRTGPRSSSPCPALSQPSSPHLAQAYKSQAGYPQWSDRSPARQEPRHTASASAGRGTLQRGPSAPLCMGHYQSLLFMITPPHSQAVPPLGPAQVHTSPWQRWQDHPHNVSGRRAKPSQFGMMERHFARMLEPQSPSFIHRLISPSADLPSDRAACENNGTSHVVSRCSIPLLQTHSALPTKLPREILDSDSGHV